MRAISHLSIAKRGERVSNLTDNGLRALDCIILTVSEAKPFSRIKKKEEMKTRITHVKAIVRRKISPLFSPRIR